MIKITVACFSLLVNLSRANDKSILVLPRKSLRASYLCTKLEVKVKIPNNFKLELTQTLSYPWFAAFSNHGIASAMLLDTVPGIALVLYNCAKQKRKEHKIGAIK